MARSSASKVLMKREATVTAANRACARLPIQRQLPALRLLVAVVVTPAAVEAEAAVVVEEEGINNFLNKC